VILQALYKLAEREGLMDDPDFEPKPVAWIVRVSSAGELLGIRGTHYTLPTEGKKKPRTVAKTFRVPRQPTGRAGIKAPPCFLVDNAKYVFGLPTKGKSFPKEEGDEKSSWFRDLVVKCSAATGDEGTLAVHRLLEGVAQGRISVDLPDECRSNDLFAFELASDLDRFVHERTKVKEYWSHCRSSANSDKTTKLTCLVSGKPVGQSGLFPLIEGVPGANPSRIGLVSFNKSAFESFGWKGNENAPISRESAEACATALNRLLDPGYPDPHQPGQALPQRSLRLSADTAVCYWPSQESGEDFTSAFSGLLEARPELVKEVYQSLWRGRLPDIDGQSTFYVLTLSGTQGRAIIRDWFESTVAKVARNLAQHFQDLAIVRNTPKPKDHDLKPQFPMTGLLESLAPQGDRERIPTPLIGQILEAALRGAPYPFSVLPRAIERARAEIGSQNADGLDGYRAKERSDARAALMKAVLNRRRRFFPETTHYKEVQPDMDPNNLSEGYTLGRLMAVLERLQQEAIDNVNASVVDRYFSGASAAPKTVFIRLLKNARHHVTKAKDELASGFDPKRNGFPAHLDLEQQGLFVLGYHQMRKWLWMTKEERAEWENKYPDAPRPYVWAKDRQ